MSNQKKRTKVLMIYPEFPVSFWDYKEAIKMLGLGATMPPTCLATVAAMLPVENFEVLPIIDLNLEPLLDKHLEQADLVMLSAMIAQKKSLREIIVRVKLSGKPVVVGGPYATSYRDSVANMGADYLVLNEAETTLLPFIHDWLAGRAKSIYDEHSVRSYPSTVTLTNEGKPIITNTPIPRWDLLKLKRYASMSVQFSRGCPFNCEFCDITSLYGHIPRAKTPTQLIGEIDAIRRLGWRGSVFIVDDNFIGNRNAVREFLPVLIEWQKKHGYPFSFFTEASVDLANEDLSDILKNMVEAGFEEVFCGLESPYPEVLAEMGKKQNRGNVEEKILKLQQAGLEVTAGFIIGSDKDRSTVFEDTFEFIKRSGIVTSMVGLLTALSGTALYKRLKVGGRLRTESSGNNTHQLSMNFEPILGEGFLINGYVDLLNALFSSRNYYARCRTLRQRLGHFHCSIPLNRSRISAALQIFYRNIVKRPDWEFIRFMFGTLFTSPRNMPVAIKQAVKLAHFQGITRQTVRVHRYAKHVATLTALFQKQVAELRGDVNKRLRGLARLERRAIQKITRMYKSLDPDFRAGAKKSLEHYHQHFIACANQYRQNWHDLKILH